MVATFLQWQVTDGYFSVFGEKHGALFYYIILLF